MTDRAKNKLYIGAGWFFSASFFWISGYVSGSSLESWSCFFMWYLGLNIIGVIAWLIAGRQSLDRGDNLDLIISTQQLKRKQEKEL